MTIDQSVLQPALVTEELRQTAEQKAEELFVALVDAKNEWQYAVKDHDAKYERVLRLKAEYAEWRGMAQRLGELMAGAYPADAVESPAARPVLGFAVAPSVERPRRTGT